MARPVVELDGFLKMLMGAGKVAELKAIASENAVGDQGLGTIRPGRGFAQEKLRDFAHRCRFAAGQMPDPDTVIGGEPFRWVFHLVRQFAGACALHRIASESAARRACDSVSSGKCLVGGKPSTAGASTACASASWLAAR